MGKWQDRAEIQNDVVFFEYVSMPSQEENQTIYVWDLDKTYLDTHFESLSGLYRTIKEKAFQKRNVPGTRSLVRAITVRGEFHFPIYFVSASPPQMEERIYEKLVFDGIKPFGMFFKDNLKNLRPSRFRRLSQQVGFKLQALLLLRERYPLGIEQVMWGDDSESDAVIYSLYSDICAQRLPEKSLKKILSHYHVRGEQVDVILDLATKNPHHDPVKRIYINLASDTDTEYYAKFGLRMLATYNSFQVALDLYQEKQITDMQLQMVATDLVKNYGFTTDELAMSMENLVKRRVLHEKCLRELLVFLDKEGFLPKNYRLKEKAISEEEFNALKSNDIWLPSFIDYLHDFR